MTTVVGSSCMVAPEAIRLAAILSIFLSTRPSQELWVEETRTNKLLTAEKE
jgi:hypothetical protein